MLPAKIIVIQSRHFNLLAILLVQHYNTDLGINWIEHYKTITARAYQTLGLIRCTFRINCVEAKKQLYIALVCS